MHISIGRRTRLTALGAGLISAAAIAFSSAGTAVADTADTGGTAALEHSPRGGGEPGQVDRHHAAWQPGQRELRQRRRDLLDARDRRHWRGQQLPGIVDLGGKLVVINTKAGKTVNITNLQLNFYTGALTGVLPGSTAHTTLGYLTGDMSTSTDPGPPATETISCTEVDLSAKMASALNTALNTKAFVRGTNLGAFTATFDVTIT